MADAALPPAKRAKHAADAAASAAAAESPVMPALSREAFDEADTNSDGRLDQAEFLELVAGGLCARRPSRPWQPSSPQPTRTAVATSTRPSSTRRSWPLPCPQRRSWSG